MENLSDTLDNPIIKNNEKMAWLTTGTLLAAGVGALALYLMIPERKRKTVFK